jgi:hypothetical protein
VNKYTTHTHTFVPQVPAVSELSEEDLNNHFETLNLPRENATRSDVVRAYKRFAPRLVETPSDLEAFTISFKVCEATVSAANASEIGGKLNSITEDDEMASPTKDNSVPVECDPFEVYHQIVYMGRKHAELKVRDVHVCMCMCVNAKPALESLWSSVTYIHTYIHTYEYRRSNWECPLRILSTVTWLHSNSKGALHN